MPNFLISSSILSADFTCLKDQIQTAQMHGIDWVHVDVMDGEFVPNISVGPLMVEAVRRITDLPLDVHLMINRPERYIQDFAHAGANHLSIHIEGGHNIHRTLESIRILNVHPSIVLNPGTPASSLQAVLPFVDMVLVMTVNPGFGGQKFIPQSLNKIAEIRRMLGEINSKAPIEVDGGINHETLPACVKAGASIFVAGNSIYNHPQGIAAGIQALRQSVVD